MRASRRRQGAVAGALALTTALVVTACGGSDSDGKTRITINTFGVFGYEKLYEEYEAAHPDIDIVENVSEYNTHHSNLLNHLASGSGAADIEAVDEGVIAELKARPNQFVNLLDLGAGDLEANYPAFKWQASLSEDGSAQIGLGTDVGGLAMCYRTDLFEKAGLPTDRDEVSALWPTWDAFIETGIRFRDANTGVKFFDSATNIYNAQVFQLERSYYDPDTGEVIVGTNPGVKEAWDRTVRAINEGLSAGLIAFQADWTTAFQQGTFATVTCPAWMQGYIQENAPGTEGLWDIATVPGNSGNWGGSWLTIPAQSDHPQEAYELIRWLTAPEQQVRVFTETGNFPSAIPAIEDPAVAGFTTPFFNNAPTGRIFGESAINLVPQFQGEKHGPIRKAMEDGLTRVEQGRQSPDEAFTQAVRDAERAAN